MITREQCRAIERASRRLDEAMAERNRIIREVYAAGGTVREIAACTEKIKHTAVHNIVRAAPPSGSAAE